MHHSHRPGISKFVSVPGVLGISRKDASSRAPRASRMPKWTYPLSWVWSGSVRGCHPRRWSDNG
ncbi:hypothetical protein OPAG_09242 [Rhodococcus opacus PD630]|nr:hypothetical protein OPAG_09242 [Rhodococcus opacus PD630]